MIVLYDLYRMKKEKKGLIAGMAILTCLIGAILALLYEPWARPVYTAHAEVTLYRTLEDGGLLTKKMENEEGKRYILIRDEDSMTPEYISKEKYERLVSENPLAQADKTDPVDADNPYNPPRNSKNQLDD